MKRDFVNNNSTAFVLAIFCSVLLTWSAQAQETRTVVVPPDSVGVLNNVIAGDTLDDGERVDPRTVYVLQRNGVYKLVGEIQNQGYPLTLRAEEGEGALPVLQPTPPSGGGTFSPFTALGDLTLDGIYLTAVNDFGAYEERMIRVQADSVRIRLLNCWFDGTGQSIVRLGNLGAKVYINRCVISNVGRTFIPNNGRVIDIRETTDSVVVTNSTIYNVTSRVLRVGDGRYVRYVDFSHNTVMNVAQRLITFGATVEARFVDNLLVNPGFLGNLRASEYVELDELNDNLREIFEEQGVEQRIEVRNNLFYTDQLVALARTDTVGDQPFYSEDVYSFSLLDSAELVDERTLVAPVTFKNAPRLPEGVLLGMVNDQLFAENIDNGTAPNWPLFASPFNLLVDDALPLPWSFLYDFSYSPTTLAATAATDGGPLGDPRWGLEETDIVTSAAEPVDAALRLYPNPAIDRLWVRLPANEPLRIRVRDIQGRMVLTQQLSANERSISLLSLRPGLYMVSIERANGFIDRTKILKQ
jgi:hypothetical protein